MSKNTHLILAAAVAVALGFSSKGVAQDTRTLPLPLPAAPAAPAASDGASMLKTLPNPRDVPASLFEPLPPPAPPAPGIVPSETPYFVRDPLLDLSGFPPPGWFTELDIQVVKPHLVNRLSGVVQNSAQKANGTSSTVALPSAPLDWAVSPRFVLGYRLPSGFGEFSVAYRFLDTAGNEVQQAQDGPATLRSQLSFNMVDLDYSNSELSCWPAWDMKWTFGLRILTMFNDSRATQPFDQAAAGSGLYQTRDSNNFYGFGPHLALDLSRHLGDSGWSLRFRTDLSSDFTSGTDSFFTGTTTPPLEGVTRVFFHQGVSIVNVQTGLTWQPSRTSGTRLFLGYQYEHWFALEGVVDSGSHGQFWDQGVVLQATFHF